MFWLFDQTFLFCNLWFPLFYRFFCFFWNLSNFLFLWRFLFNVFFYVIYFWFYALFLFLFGIFLTRHSHLMHILKKHICFVRFNPLYNTLRLQWDRLIKNRVNKLKEFFKKIHFLIWTLVILFRLLFFRKETFGKIRFFVCFNKNREDILKRRPLKILRHHLRIRNETSI